MKVRAEFALGLVSEENRLRNSIGRRARQGGGRQFSRSPATWMLEAGVNVSESMMSMHEITQLRDVCIPIQIALLPIDDCYICVGTYV